MSDKYAVIAAHRAEYPIALMCRVLAVSRSGFYAAQGRGPSERATADGALATTITATFARCQGRYGPPPRPRGPAAGWARRGTQAGGAAHAGGGSPGPSAAPVRSHDRQLARVAHRGERAGAGLCRRRAGESRVGQRHHLHPDARGVAVSRGRDRLGVALRSRVGDECPERQRPGRGGAPPGRGPAAPGAGRLCRTSTGRRAVAQGNHALPQAVPRPGALPTDRRRRPSHPGAVLDIGASTP